MPPTAPRHALVPLLLLALAACGGDATPPPSAPPPPNVALLTLDTVRRDHLATYGYGRATTPVLDAFAEQCLVFERCFSPIAHTTPSHISLLTGVYPPEHGVTANTNLQSEDVQEASAFVPTPTLVSFASHLAGRGWSTGGFVSAAPLKEITGLSRGFDAWDEPEDARRPGRETIAAATRWLDGRPPDAPWFLWLHLFDAHGPYARGEQPPAPYDALFGEDEFLRAHLAELGFPAQVKGRQVGKTTPAEAVNLYDGSLRWLDDQLAPFLAALEARPDWDRTVVVVVGDHGQGLGQHDYLAHGVVWDEQLAVPLFLRVPGRAPARASALLSTVDVLPTLLGQVPALADPGLARQFRGTDALAEGARPALFGMSPPKRGLVMLREERWKLVSSEEDGDQLYDLEADPHELDDASARAPEELQRMRARLSELRGSLQETGARHAAERAALPDAEGPGAAGAADADHARELSELGYGGEDEDEDGR